MKSNRNLVSGEIEWENIFNSHSHGNIIRQRRNTTELEGTKLLSEHEYIFTFENNIQGVRVSIFISIKKLHLLSSVKTCYDVNEPSAHVIFKC